MNMMNSYCSTYYSKLSHLGCMITQIDIFFYLNTSVRDHCKGRYYNKHEKGLGRWNILPISHLDVDHDLWRKNSMKWGATRWTLSKGYFAIRLYTLERQTIEKVVNVSLIRGLVEKGWNCMIPFLRKRNRFCRIFIQCFPVWIRHAFMMSSDLCKLGIIIFRPFPTKCWLVRLLTKPFRLLLFNMKMIRQM
jgi:hypothetical protein